MQNNHNHLLEDDQDETISTRAVTGQSTEGLKAIRLNDDCNTIIFINPNQNVEQERRKFIRVLNRRNEKNNGALYAPQFVTFSGDDELPE